MGKKDDWLYVDTTEAQRLIDKATESLSKKNFEILVYRVMRRTSARVKTIVKKEVPKQYAVKASWVGAQIGSPKIERGSPVKCYIPLRGQRGIIGGVFRMYKTRGRKSKKKLKQAIRIKAALVKGETSILPAELKKQGKAKPFVMKGMAFARRQDNKKVVRVVGLNLPRMPMNRPKEQIQEQIVQTMKERIAHEYNQIIAGIRREKGG